MKAAPLLLACQKRGMTDDGKEAAEEPQKGRRGANFRRASRERDSIGQSVAVKYKTAITDWDWASGI